MAADPEPSHPLNPIDSWLRLFSPTIKFPDTIRYPGGGDIGGFVYQPQTQWGAPTLSVGDAHTEYRIYSEVASPGKQLGKLTEAVLTLAAAMEAQARGEAAAADVASCPAINCLQEMAKEVEAVKAKVEEAAEKHARLQLQRLADSDPAALRRLLTEFAEKAR